MTLLQVILAVLAIQVLHAIVYTIANRLTNNAVYISGEDFIQAARNGFFRFMFVTSFNLVGYKEIWKASKLFTLVYTIVEVCAFPITVVGWVASYPLFKLIAWKHAPLA